MDRCFTEVTDCIRNLSSTTAQKVVSALHQLSSGVTADGLVDILCISESMIHECRKRFTSAVIQRFEAEYLRRPTMAGAHFILDRQAELGFPGSFVSLHCSRWKLSCVLVVERHKTIGKSGIPKYRIESWVNDRRWIWHLNFDFPGAMNYLNILDCSPLFGDFKGGKRPFFMPTVFIACRIVDWLYWIVNRIYPHYQIFLKTIPKPVTKKEKVFSTSQEAFRKNVEIIYVILFSILHVLAIPSRLWHKSDMKNFVACCAILHNMIVDQRDKDGSMETTNIVSDDSNSAVTPIRCSELSQITLRKENYID